MILSATDIMEDVNCASSSGGSSAQDAKEESHCTSDSISKLQQGLKNLIASTHFQKRCFQGMSE